MPASSSWDFPSARILVVDDNEVNQEIVCDLLTLEGYSNLTALSGGQAAVDSVLAEPPDLVLLDLHMPGVSGYDVLYELGNRLPSDVLLPILVFTADCTPQARSRALRLGASDFISKPVDNTELTLRVRNFLRMRRMHLALGNENIALEERVQNRTQELVRARSESLGCLARALEYRDDETGDHVRRVGILSAELAGSLGLPQEMVELIRLAAPLHDLGKIGIRDSLLLKEGKYLPEERQAMQRHANLGATIIGDCASPVLQLAKEISLYHHERWDGQGYPEGLQGEAIPISCRIVAAVDMLDALMSERPYKRAWNLFDAVAEIEAQSGRHLDPKVSSALIRLAERGTLNVHYPQRGTLKASAA